MFIYTIWRHFPPRSGIHRVFASSSPSPGGLLENLPRRRAHWSERANDRRVYPDQHLGSPAALQRPLLGRSNEILRWMAGVHSCCWIAKDETKPSLGCCKMQLGWGEVAIVHSSLMTFWCYSWQICGKHGVTVHNSALVNTLEQLQ